MAAIYAGAAVGAAFNDVDVPALHAFAIHFPMLSTAIVAGGHTLTRHHLHIIGVTLSFFPDLQMGVADYLNGFHSSDHRMVLGEIETALQAAVVLGLALPTAGQSWEQRLRELRVFAAQHKANLQPMHAGSFEPLPALAAGGLGAWFNIATIRAFVRENSGQGYVDFLLNAGPFDTPAERAVTTRYHTAMDGKRVPR